MVRSFKWIGNSSILTSSYVTDARPSKLLLAQITSRLVSSTCAVSLPTRSPRRPLSTSRIWLTKSPDHTCRGQFPMRRRARVILHINAHLCRTLRDVSSQGEPNLMSTTPDAGRYNKLVESERQDVGDDNNKKDLPRSSSTSQSLVVISIPVRTASRCRSLAFKRNNDEDEDEARRA